MLLAQLGTPEAPTPRALRRYLGTFLADPRVVDLNPWLWRPLLHAVVLRTRPKRSAALYERVWTERGSPLLYLSQDQRDGVAARLGDGYRVELGMRIGEPSIAGALDRLMEAGCRHVVVLPMFPQYSSATTASMFDAVAEWAKERRNLPAFSFVRSFADHPAFIEAWRAQVVETGIRPTKDAPLLLAFHGIPERYAQTGDPYPQECEATARALVAALGLSEGTWRIVYQSRFGREPWLRPYADETLRALPPKGVRSVSILSASFVADCLETIDEIGREARRTFEEAGGETYVRVPCPNASPAMCDALAAIVREHVPAAAGLSRLR